MNKAIWAAIAMIVGGLFLLSVAGSFPAVALEAKALGFTAISGGVIWLFCELSLDI